MENILIIALLVLTYLLFSKNKEPMTNLVTYETNLPSNCNTSEERPYPSGKVPGSYLGLSQAEHDMLLIKFMDYNGTLN